MNGPYRAIHCDPPWSWQARSAKGEGRSARNHYSVMSLDKLFAMRAYIGSIADDDCALFLWTLNSMRPQAHALIEAWGFVYKTVGFTWAKQTSTGGWHFGCGYWTRQNSEQCLLATRGRPKRLSRSVPELIVAPRREHSRKPAEVYTRIQQLVPGPYLDLFSRENRPGWSSWGLEAGKFDQAA